MTARFDWKKAVRVGLIVLLAADVVLLMWVWQLRGAAPEAQAAQRDILRRQHAALGGDVQQAALIRTRLPEVEKQCDQFLQQQILPQAGGYSVVVEDLNRMASQTGLTARGVQYKQKELKERGVSEVEVTANIEGGYANVVRFINALERSKQFYLLKELTLAESSGGISVRLSLQLKTYFRLAT